MKVSAAPFSTGKAAAHHSHLKCITTNARCGDFPFSVFCCFCCFFSISLISVFGVTLDESHSLNPCKHKHLCTPVEEEWQNWASCSGCPAHNLWLKRQFHIHLLKKSGLRLRKAETADLIVDIWIQQMISATPPCLTCFLRQSVDFSEGEKKKKKEIQFGSRHFVVDLQGKHYNQPHVSAHNQNWELEERRRVQTWCLVLWIRNHSLHPFL